MKLKAGFSVFFSLIGFCLFVLSYRVESTPLASIHENLGFPKPSALKSQNIPQKGKNEKVDPSTLEIQGIETYQKGDILTSIDIFKNSLREYRKAKDISGQIRSYLHLAENFTALKEFDRASLYLDMVNTLPKDNLSKNELLEFYTLTTSLDTARGDFKNAFFFNLKRIKLEDSLNTKEKEGLIQNLSKDFSDAQTEREKAVQEAKEQALANREKYTLEIGVLLVALLLVGLIFVYSMYKTKKRAVLSTENANRLIKEKNEELERLNQLKNKLFSIIAHDLRSPLNNLTGVLSLIGQGLLEQDEIHQLTNRLHNNVKETTNFLDNLLIWSRAQMNGLSTNRQELNLFKLTNEAIEIFRFQIEEKRLFISNMVDQDLLVYADREMIRIVLRNLISNAIKFSIPGQGIMIKGGAKMEDEQALISIEDHGIGIPKEIQDKLFGSDSYTTLGTRDEKGSGIGLMLCRDFVEKNGGKIWMQSIPEIGSTFYFTLPQYHMAKRDETIKNLLADIL